MSGYLIFVIKVHALCLGYTIFYDVLSGYGEREVYCIKEVHLAQEIGWCFVQPCGGALMRLHTKRLRIAIHYGYAKS
jgi:hypothetical protein